MHPVKLSSFLALLLLLCFSKAFAKTQKVLVRPNGYEGNLYHKIDGVRWAFYTKGYKEIPVTMELTKENQYVFDNGSHVGGSAFGILEENGKFYNASPNSIKEVFSFIDRNGETIVVITLNTVKVKIESNGLTAPYKLSAFQLGDDQHVYNYVKGDQEMKLIAGLKYDIDNGMNDIVDMVNYDGDIRDEAASTFYFDVDVKGNISCNSAAARASGNKLTFNVAKVEIDPARLTEGLSEQVRIPYGNDPYYFIKKPQTVTVFRHLVTILSWEDANKKLFHYIFRAL